jgi:peptidoglycan hydrolase-like protein with peptidoglycan-binding domain
VATPAAPTAAKPAAVTLNGNNDPTLVKAAQAELQRLGYKVGVDGAYGPNTKKAITAFQASHSLTADGNVSPDLVSALKAAPTPMGTATSEKNEMAAEKKAEPAAAPEKKAAAAPAPQQKAEPAATPAKAADYDRFYQYEGSSKQMQGAWLIIRDKAEPIRFYGEIRGDELITQQDLRSLTLAPGASADLRELVMGPFRKTDSYTPPSIVILRFDGEEITARNISNGGSAKQTFQAKGPEVTKLLNHLQDGNNFDYRIEHFDPFISPKEWATFHAPPPSIAAAKQAEKDKQAAAMAAEKAEQEKKAAYAGTLTPEAKMAYEQCNQNYAAENFYDCQCIAQNLEKYMGPQIDSSADYWKKRIAGYEGAIETNNASTKLTAERKAQLEKGIRQQIERAKGELAKIEDRANWDKSLQKSMVQGAQLQLYKDPACKVGEGMREKEYKACLASASPNILKGKTPEEFCSCSAKTAAELWLASTEAYSSKVAVGIPVKARTQCRN